MDPQRELRLSRSGSQEISHSTGFFVGSSGLEAFRVVNDVWKTRSRKPFLHVMLLMCIGVDMRLDETISDVNCFVRGDVHGFL